MLNILICSNIVIVIVMIKIAYSRNNAVLLLYGLFTFFYGILRAILLKFGLYSKYAYLNPTILNVDLAAVSSALLYLLLANIILCFSLKAAAPRVKFHWPTPLKNLNYTTRYLLASCCFLLSLIFPLVGLFAFAFLVYLFSATIMDKGSDVHTFIFFSLVVCWLYLFSEDRRDWLIIILFVSLYSRKMFLIKNLLKKLAFGSAGLACLIYISVAFRTDGLLEYEAVFDRLSTSSAAIGGILEVETDFSIVSDDYFLLFDERYGHVHKLLGASLIKPFVSFIPRTIWPSKPETSSRLYPKFYNNYYYLKGGSQPVTIWGEFYWNFGWFSLVLFIFLGMFFRSMSELFLGNSSFKLSVFFFSFHIFRGPIDSFSLIVIFLFIVTCFLRRV